MDSISKELLSEVLGEDIEVFKENTRYINVESTVNGYTYGTNYDVHYIAHRCKEWAYDMGYDIYSSTKETDVCMTGSNYSVAPFHYCNTEPEAIFKACEWIRKQNNG